MRIEKKMSYVQKYGREMPTTWIDGIPFVFLNKRGLAANLRIGNSKQLCFIPLSFVDTNGFIIGNIDWWFNKKTLQHKIELYKEEIPNG